MWEKNEELNTALKHKKLRYSNQAVYARCHNCSFYSESLIERLVKSSIKNQSIPQINENNHIQNIDARSFLQK